MATQNSDDGARRPSVAIIGTRGYPSYYGGFETAVRYLAPFLAEHGWEVVVYSREGATRPDDSDRDDRVETRYTKGLESKSLSTLTYGLTATLDSARRVPDVALVMNVANGYWLPLLRRKRIPSVVNVDGIEWDRAKWGRLAKQVFRTGARLTARYGDTLVFDAEEIGRRWGQDFAREGEFIPYGGTMPDELPIEPGLEHRGYVLVVARFVPENTVPEFIDAAEKLAAHYPIVIVGSSGYGGELDDRVKALAESYPSVHWLGHVSDDKRLHALWQHAGAYFHGHSVGGTNPALVQAMACGAPTVARDTVYNREVLEDAGAFCQPTPESIADAIKSLMGSPERQERLSTAARERAEERYTWQRVCEDYERALLEAIEAKKK